MSETLKSNNLYSNWKMFSPTGVLMCRLAEKRAMWYVHRGLAELGETSIQLKFDPNGLGHRSEHSFLLEARDNKCVVCGSVHELTKHHVIPHQYRRHFNLDLKARSSYDVLMVCENCHHRYETLANIRNVELCKMHNVVVPKQQFVKNELSSAAAVIVTMRNGILRGNIPAERVEFFTEKLRVHFGTSDFSDEQLKTVLVRKTEIVGKSAGEQLVSKLNDSELEQFILDWRAHFMEHMKPKFIPSTWTIFHDTTIDEI